MAFALALKSLTDFNEFGEAFLIITLIYIAFSLFYSSILSAYVIRKCDILKLADDQKPRPLLTIEELHNLPDSNFKDVKIFFHSIHKRLLLPFVSRQKLKNDDSKDSFIKEELNENPKAELEESEHYASLLESESSQENLRFEMVVQSQSFSINN